MGWHLDGRVTACVGTHTHVPTADARVLPGGTAYVSDVGMTGARGGVIGVRREQAVERFLTMMPVKFETAEEDPWLNAVLVEAGAGGRATRIEQLLVEAPR
jgi:calcineurin-like phosphoesterase